MLTVDEVQQAVPKNLRIRVDQELVDKLNNISTDPEVARHMRENFISYTVVMKDGRYKIDDYLNAVAYVSFKLMGYSNRDSYMRTFPDRYRALVARGASDKDISSFVAIYNKNKLVNLILDQSMIPTHVFNQDIHQDAINHLAYLMTNANSEKVQAEAAIGLLTALKKPEVKKIELDVSTSESASMSDLKETLMEMAKTQQRLIENGMPTQAVAQQVLVKKPMKDITPIEIDGDFGE